MNKRQIIIISSCQGKDYLIRYAQVHAKLKPKTLYKISWFSTLELFLTEIKPRKTWEKDPLDRIFNLDAWRWSVLFLYSVYKKNIYKINDPYLHPCWKKTKLWQRCTPWNYMCYVHEQRVKTFKCIKGIFRPKISLAGGRPGIGRLGPRRNARYRNAWSKLQSYIQFNRFFCALLQRFFFLVLEYGTSCNSRGQESVTTWTKEKNCRNVRWCQIKRVGINR